MKTKSDSILERRRTRLEEERRLREGAIAEHQRELEVLADLEMAWWETCTPCEPANASTQSVKPVSGSTTSRSPAVDLRDSLLITVEEFARRIHRAVRLTAEHEPDEVESPQPRSGSDYAAIAVDVIEQVAKGQPIEVTTRILKSCVEGLSQSTDASGCMRDFMGELRAFANRYTHRLQTTFMLGVQAPASQSVGREATVWEACERDLRESDATNEQMSKIEAVLRQLRQVNAALVSRNQLQAMGIPAASINKLENVLGIEAAHSVTTVGKHYRIGDAIKLAMAWRPKSRA